MALSKEELMQPRYKVIADYPGNMTPIGTILRLVSKEIAGRNTLWWGGNHRAGSEISFAFWASTDLSRYPAIFQRLEWWEDRAVEDLPEYVKFNRHDNGELKVVKIASWDLRDIGDVAFRTTEKDWCLCNYHDFPATEEEYNEYILLQKA